MRVADIALENASRVCHSRKRARRDIWLPPASLGSAGGSPSLCRIQRSPSSARRAGCGLGQRRTRLFLLCWRGSDCIRIDIRGYPSLTVRDALYGIEDVDDAEGSWPKPHGRDWLIARRIPPGHKLSNVRFSQHTLAAWDIPEVYGATSRDERAVLRSVARLRRRERVRPYGDGDPVSEDRLTTDVGRPVGPLVERLVRAGYLRRAKDGVELRQTFNGRYRQPKVNSPSPTVDTKFGRIDLFLHPDENRAMTPREAARLQGFPDDFMFLRHQKGQVCSDRQRGPPRLWHLLWQIHSRAILKA